jgi:hypothetical protein
MTTQVQEPRSGSEMLGGIPWLARMTDKARLEAAGQIDQFDLEYPCPMDQRCLAQLGIDGVTFQKIAVSAQTDVELLEALKALGISP